MSLPRMVIPSEGYRTVTDYSIDIHVRIPLPLIEKIEAFCKTMNKRNRNEGIRDLLKVALIFHENALLIQKNPNRIEEIHNELKEGELVDSIQKIQGKDFHILYDIVVSEYKARFGSKLLKHI